MKKVRLEVLFYLLAAQLNKCRVIEAQKSLEDIGSPLESVVKGDFEMEEYFDILHKKIVDRQRRFHMFKLLS